MHTASLAKLLLDCGVNVIHMRACYVCRFMSRESVGAVPLCIQCLVLLSLLQYGNATYTCSLHTCSLESDCVTEHSV